LTNPMHANSSRCILMRVVKIVLISITPIDASFFVADI